MTFIDDFIHIHQECLPFDVQETLDNFELSLEIIRSIKRDVHYRFQNQDINTIYIPKIFISGSFKAMIYSCLNFNSMVLAQDVSLLLPFVHKLCVVHFDYTMNELRPLRNVLHFGLYSKCYAYYTYFIDKNFDQMNEILNNDPRAIEDISIITLEETIRLLLHFNIRFLVEGTQLNQENYRVIGLVVG